jgi:Flp pilus assembly protein CpaB
MVLVRGAWEVYRRGTDRFEWRHSRMSAQIRQPRTRGGGGRTLMLLGVILALAAGIMVIYVVSTAGSQPNHEVTVVVAAKDLSAGTSLSAPGAGTDPSHTLISDAFTTKAVNSDFVPQGAYVYVSSSQLNIDLNDEIVTGQFYVGDILRAADPRLAKIGSVVTGSLTFRTPAALPKGSVLYPFKADDLDSLVAGDHVDVLVTYCGVKGVDPNFLNGCEAQTTLENVYVYAVNKGILYVVLTHQDSLTLQLLSETGAKLTLAIRKPGDTDPANTVPINGQYIYSHFHYQP